MPVKEKLIDTQALVRVLEAAEQHTLPVPELIEKALGLQGWRRTRRAAGRTRP